MSPPQVVRFGTFELDLSSGELSSRGRRVRLQGQPAQILVRLVRTPGQIVARDELRRTIWADDTFVDFDTSLNVAVNKIRHALRDSASAPRFVETVPKQGYRFLGEVRPVPHVDPEAAAAAVGSARPGVLRGLAAGLAAAVVALAVVGWVVSRRVPDSADETIRSLAVLPFHPLTDEARDEALELGLAEAVILRLSRVPKLRVPSIYAVRHFAQYQPDSRMAGRDLGVDAVLEGSVLRVDGQVRLSARVIDVETGTTRWAQQWDFPWTDIFAVQDAMASEVSRALALNVTSSDRQGPSTRPTNVAAYDPYLRARSLLLRRSLSDSRRAAELLEEALRLDPTSSAAHASLAFAYVSIPLLDGPSEPFVELARQAAQRALELDAGLAEAHAVLGRIAIHFDWMPEEAHRAMRRALALGPEDPFVLHCSATLLAEDGHIAEALALTDRALGLDPASVLANSDKSYVLLLARRYEDAIAQGRRTLELDAHAPAVHVTLGRSYEQLGRIGDAVEAYVTPLTFSEDRLALAQGLRRAAARNGPRGFWAYRLQVLLAAPTVSNFSVAFTYLKLGDHGRALEWLERLYAARGGQMLSLKMSPEWDPLRMNPRFDALLRRANITRSAPAVHSAIPSGLSSQAAMPAVHAPSIEPNPGRDEHQLVSHARSPRRIR